MPLLPAAAPTRRLPGGPLLGLERSLHGELDEVLPLIPEFDRVPFGSGVGGAGEGGENAFLDAIVRRANSEQGLGAVPVGVVSKRYCLVSHVEVAQSVRSALAARGVHPREIDAEAFLTVNGARMGLFVRLPREYDFDPGDGRPMALRLLCLNSVDGSSPLRLLLGWYRFVCANGLAVGTTQSELRLVHREGSRCGDVAELLREGIALAEREKAGLRFWGSLLVPLARFVSFADGGLAAAWGVRAAARFLHIATTGFDAELANPFEPGPPHAKTMTITRRVAGSPFQAGSAYDACQILAWIAKDRREAQERVDWMMQIPGLMQGMLGRG
jgi:hypothetical protein